MPRRPLSELTPEQQEERRAYFRNAKAESRERLREAHQCIVRTSRCTGKAKKGGTTCRACDEVRLEQANAAARKNGGWTTAPSKKIPRTIRKLYRQGSNIRDIVQDPYLMDYNVTQKEILEVLKEASLL